MNSNFSSEQEIFAGVPQVSILGPILFNIFVNNIFLFFLSFFSFCSNLSNDADDNTLYTSGYNLEEVKEVLLNDLNKVTEWFFENYLVRNAGKCHFMCLGKTTENETFTFKDTTNSKEEKILGVFIVNRLTSSSHIKTIISKSFSKNIDFVKNVKLI